MEEKKVKGTMLIDFVRMVRSNKNLDWNKYMQPEDWDFINSKILPSNWYPFDFYARLGWASFNLVGNGDLELARLNGQIMAQHLFETTYTSMVKFKDPNSQPPVEPPARNTLVSCSPAGPPGSRR